MPLLVGAKAAGRKPLPRTGRRWPASGAPVGETCDEAEGREVLVAVYHKYTLLSIDRALINTKCIIYSHS